MRSPRENVTVASLVVASFSLAVLLMLATGQTNAYGVELLVSALIGSFIAFYLSFMIRTFNKNPTPITAALIGEPGAGKTVYLSVLFSELSTTSDPSIAFSLYGVDTIETVSRNIKVLGSGRWLPPTPATGLFTFRANAVLKSAFLSKRYTVEIGDFAGEHIDEFDPTSDQWLHRTDYFQYALSADIIFLVADGGRMLEPPRQGVDETQQRLIAALQVLVDKKGVSPDAGLWQPVILLVTKADLLQKAGKSKEDVISELNQLTSVCRRLCNQFEVFLVSSVGHIGERGEPPTRLAPVNVVQPMLWALRHVRA